MLKPEDLTDEMIDDARRDEIISPFLANAATRVWHTGTGLARIGARIEITNEINAAATLRDLADDERWLASEKRQIEADQYSLDMRTREFERRSAALTLKKLKLKARR